VKYYPFVSLTLTIGLIKSFIIQLNILFFIKIKELINMKKIMAMGVIGMFLLTSFSVFVVAERQTCSGQITLSYSFETPVIEKIEIGDDVYDRVNMSDAPCGGNPGEPRLPGKGAYILLPQGTKVNEIKVTPGERVCLGNGFMVEPVGKGVPLSYNGSVPLPKPDEEIYRSSDIFPEKLYSRIGTYSFRGANIIVLKLHPVQYIPASGELFYYPDLTISVNTIEDEDVNPLYRGLERDIAEFSKKVDNSDVVTTYIQIGSGTGSTDEYDLVIITTDSLKDGFEPLKNAHEAEGVKTLIYTVEDVYSEYSGVDNAEKIRNFTRDAYLNWGTEYVLLGGDIDVVPARFLYVEAWKNGTNTIAPADLYYGCLDGTYNYDGDDRWGEPTDGENGGDVDLRAEVYIGRACVGNESEVSNFVMKTLAYEQTPIDDPYLRKALMVGEYLGWAWGGNYKDEIIDGSSNHWYSTVGIPSDLYNIDTLYDREWENNNWPKSEIISRINAGFNIINHIGHSLHDENMKMLNSDVDDLINDEYCFIYSQGCTAGGFDHDDCIAEHFTVKTTHGAFAGIWNARYGWGMAGSTDGPSQRFDREFFDAIFSEGVRYPKKTCLGVANQDSKEDNLWRINEPCMRWCYYVLNLFGDPQVSLKPVPIYEHDLAVDSLTLSDPVLPDESFTVTTRIVNQGLSNETDVLGNISIIEILDIVHIEETQVYEYPWSIDSLVSGGAAVFELNYLLPQGLYQISANIQPHPGEEVLFNNHMGIVIFIGENIPPEKPAKPSGPTNGEAGKEYTYSTSTNDPEGDQVYYKWFWGWDPMFPSYGYYSDWLGPYDSGEIIYTSNIWNYEGQYEIKVRAKDVYGALSDWSDPLSITMPLNQPDSSQSSSQSGQQQSSQQSSTSLFFRILERPLNPR